MDFLRPGGGADGPAGKLKKIFEQIDAGDEAVVLELIESDLSGDVNVADETGTTPLLLAASLGKVDIVKALMDKKADLMASDLEGDNVLMMAISQNHLDVVQILLNATDSVDPDVPNKIGQTPLMKAVSKNNGEVVQKLLELKVNVNATSQAGKTALVEAVEKKHMDLADTLLSAGAQASIADSRGRTVLFPAAFRCDTVMLQKLLDANADPLAKAKQVGTALMMAVESPCFKQEALKLLIDHGCPVDGSNEQGETALMRAVLENNADAVGVLLDAKADTSKKNKAGQTALDLAKGSALEEVLKLPATGGYAAS